MAYKFRIVSRKSGERAVQFLYNATIIVWSENYKSRATALNCIASLQKNAPAAPVVDLTQGETGKGYRFEIAESRNKQFYVRFVARNGETMVRSETYPSKANAKKAIAAVQTKGPGAQLAD
jgi:uncharacterized protein YegP (UPF0339 family)